MSKSPTISLQAYTLEPSLDNAALPTNNKTNYLSNDEKGRSTKEFWATDAVHGFRSHTTTDGSRSSGRYETKPASNHLPIHGPSPDPSLIEAGMFPALYHDAALESTMQSPRQELHPETVIKLLRATVKKIICSETTVPSQHRSKVGRTTQDWHKLRIGMCNLAHLLHTNSNQTHGYYPSFNLDKTSIAT